MKALITIPDSLAKLLSEVCSKESISRSEAIRRAITMYTAQSPHLAPKEQAFGLWKGRNIDSLKYEQKIRKEWDKK